MAKHDIFLSYATKDAATAVRACEWLEAKGIKCWIAPRDIQSGMDWSEAIIDALTESRAFVLIFSSTSNVSEQVKREVQNAVTEALPILPYRIEDVPLSKHMRYFIGTSHWLNALTPQEEEHLEHLAETLRVLLARSSSSDEVMAMNLDDFVGNSSDNLLMEAGVEHIHLKAGEVLFSQGEAGDSMYILVSGTMDIRVASPDGVERTLATVAPTAVIGEMSLFLDKPRSATAQAQSDAVLWKVTHGHFATAIGRRDRWAVKVLLGISQVMAHRLDSMVHELVR